MSLQKTVQKTKQGMQLHVQVTVQASHSCFPTGYNKWRECLQMCVQSKPTNNEANEEIIQVIATFFQIPKATVQIISGGKQRYKIIRLMDVSYTEIVSKLEEALGEDKRNS